MWLLLGRKNALQYRALFTNIYHAKKRYVASSNTYSYILM